MQRFFALTLATLALAATTPGSAQDRLAPTLSLSAGASAYDLAGTGTGFAAAARVELSPRSYLVIEPGLVYFTDRQRFEDRFSFLLPEVSLQAQATLGTLRPYVGGGIGFATVVSGGDGEELTLHGTLGARLGVGAGWGVRAELRVRAVDPFAGSMADITAGVSRRL